MWCDEWEITRVFIDQGSSVDNLYYYSFERLFLDLDNLKAFQGSLVEFLGEKV